MTFILISKEEFLHCKILLREFDCILNVVQHLPKAHLRYLREKAYMGMLTIHLPTLFQILSLHSQTIRK